MCFIEVPSDKAEVNVKMSKKNEKEAEILVEVLSKILDANKVEPISVGIITPYAAQVIDFFERTLPFQLVLPLSYC